MTAVKRLSRDELASLIGVNHSTMGVWRHRGLVGSPTMPGTTGRQAQYDADRAFETYCFALAARQPSVRLEEASTISRYLQARPGTVRLLRSYWSKPVLLRFCPTFDLAAFAPPGPLLYDVVMRAKEAVNAKFAEHRDDTGSFRTRPDIVISSMAEEIPIDVLLSQLQLGPTGSIDPEDWDEIRSVEAASAPEHSLVNERGAIAGRIFRNQKTIQYGDVARHNTYQDTLDQLDLSDMTLEQTVLAEGWAITFLDEVLYFNGLKARDESNPIEVHTIDVTEAVRDVSAACEVPELPIRRLREPQAIPVVTV